MSFETTSPKVIYNGNDTANVFSVPFLFQANTDLVVRIKSAIQEYDLVLNTDYLVEGANEVSGGTVELVDLEQAWLVAGKLKTDFKILIKRNPDVVQGTSFRNAGPYLASTHEDAFDRNVFYDQALKEKVDRGIYFNEFLQNMVGEFPTPENGQYLAWDGVTGRLKNSSVTIDPLLLNAGDITYDNSGSTLTAANVEAAINELDIKAEALDVRVTDTESDITSLDTRLGTAESDISAIETLINGFFPIGKIDMTLTNDAPNNLNWLRISGLGAQTFPKAGTYTNLYNYLNTKGFFVAFTHDLFLESGLNFTIEDFAALSPRAIGSSVVNGRTKVGPSEGSVQEDQMQKITGTYTISQSFSGDNSATGAMTNVAGATSTFTGVTNNTRTRSIIDFDSADSSNARASSTNDGETRSNTFGVYYWIRY